MLYTSPQVAPDRIGGFYPATYSAHAARRATAQGARRLGSDPWDVLPEIGDRRLLDVGCGSGGYLLRQRATGWRVCGVEPNRQAVEAARAIGLDLFEGSIPGVKLPSQEFDVITMLAALPCVPRPMDTLRELRRMLVRGGRLIVSAHNAGSAAAEMLGAFWPGWDLPRGLNHFTPATLSEMLARAGFLNVRLSWKRRSSRWRDGAQARAGAEGGLWWKAVGASRALARAVAAIYSRGARSDEIVAVAEG